MRMSNLAPLFCKTTDSFMKQLHNYAPSKHLPFMSSGLQRNTTGMTAHLQLFATVYNLPLTRTSTTKNLKQKVKKKPSI